MDSRGGSTWRSRNGVWAADRGVQYASVVYQQVLAAHGLVPSMSRVGDCWDNAPVESFFSHLKTELLLERPWPSRAVASHAIADLVTAHG